MDHAQKRALQGTNEVSGLGLRSLRLPPYTPALFLARCAAIFVAYPAQNLNVTTTWSPDNKPGSMVLVQVRYTFNFTIPFITLKPVNLTSTSQMMISY